MGRQFLMGNGAIAWGALCAGVNLICGYPGTPSTEILETAAKVNDGSIYVEWSVNEKAALEVAAGASYAGARTLVTMKQVGMNVASDPLMSLAYVGVKGGMVIVVADDPGPISSQTEQDTRTFARFAKVPIFDPSTPEEAYAMVADAFAISEAYRTPVILRPTTRICHGCASVEIADRPEMMHTPEGFVKDPARFVIFPRASYQNHIRLELQAEKLSHEFSSYSRNRLWGSGKKGIASGGVSDAYVSEALPVSAEVQRLKISTPYPFPEELAVKFLRGVEEVIVFEELDPVIERELLYICGKYQLSVKIHGKLDGILPPAGESSTETVKRILADYLSLDVPAAVSSVKEKTLPETPARPPVLCAGCPHRASFYAIKEALKGRRTVCCGDIGCYTLGNAAPLEMVDTCLCMGAGVTIAQGLDRIEPDVIHVACIGDSTFFASGMTGVVNAVYNQTDLLLAILDNSTTAMTGQQPHPGTGRTMMGGISEKISIEKLLSAMGVASVETVDPLKHAEAVGAVRRAAEQKGVRAVIFRSPCISVKKSGVKYTVGSNCIGCLRCIRELGCPALVRDGKRVHIESGLCAGCSLCAQVCPAEAIGRKDAY